MKSRRSEKQHARNRARMSCVRRSITDDRRWGRAYGLRCPLVKQAVSQVGKSPAPPHMLASRNAIKEDNHDKTARSVTGLVVLVWLTWLAPAHANVVSDWNVVILQCVRRFKRHPLSLPVVGSGWITGIALVEAAVHDAVQAIEGKFQPCYSDEQVGHRVSRGRLSRLPHRVLVLLYPGQQGALDAFLHQLPDN